MDPFTICTGVAGFLSLTIELVKILTNYTTTVKSAPSDAQILLTEVVSLSQVLQQLTNFLKKPEHNINFRETSILCSVITICDARIKKLHSKLLKLSSAGDVMDRWKWPFQKQECLDIAQTLHRCVQTIELSFAISNGELLSRTSQELTTALADRKQQCDSMFALLQVIPPELQQMQNNINEVMRSVPIIESLASDLQQVKNAILQLQHQNNVSRLENIQKWFSPLEPHKRHHDIKSTRIHNTGEWVLGTDAYQAWMASSTPEDRILSFYGMPGAGKTFIASMMIENLHTKNVSNPKIGVAYLYCDYRDQKNQNITNIMGSLTNQLLELLDEKDFDVIFEQIEVERKKKNYVSLKLIVKTLKLVWRMFDQLFICLDAIDELEIETQNSFMKSVQEMFNMSNNSQTDTAGKILLCFTARPHVKDMVTQVLGNNPRSVTITANDDDIRKYIVHQLDINPYPKLMNDDLRQQLLTKIPQNSQGMFLLSALQMQVILQELTIAKRKAAIERLPTDLYAAFRTSLERIRTSSGPAQELGMKVLMWTHLARRQLHLEEILHALAVEDGATDLDPDNIPLEETILQCCNGLVVIDHEASEVRLVHYSLQEFFKLYGSEYFPDGDKEITRTCLTYLNFTPLFVHCTKMEEMKHLLRRYHLLEYAAGQWGHHAVHQFDDNLKYLALRLLDLERSPVSVQYCFYTRDRFTYKSVLELDSTPPYRWWVSGSDWHSVLPASQDPSLNVSGGIHVAAAFGLEPIVQYLLTTPHWQGEKLNQVPVRRGYLDECAAILFQPTKTPLCFAASRGHIDMVSLLLQQHNLDINATGLVGGTALSQAVYHRHEGVLRLLLEHRGINVNYATAGALFEKVAPLLYAAEHGHERVVRLLLEHPEINVNAQSALEEYPEINVNGRSALAAAAKGGHEGVVRLLLEHPEIDVNKWGPLEAAAKHRHEGVVRLLLEHPKINVNNGRPLTAAAVHGHESVVRLLLEHPEIDVNKWGPLSNAARDGHEGVVRLLLEHPKINVNTFSSLAVAAGHGHEGVVRLLLEQPGIDVNKWGPLKDAAKRGHEGVVRLLLEHPEIDVDNGRPLTAAAVHGHESVVRLLLEHPEIDVNKWGPLEDAARRGHEGVVRLLLEHPEIDVNNRGPLAAAAKGGHEGVARLLLEHPEINVNRTTYPYAYGTRTPLSHAAEHGHERVVRLLLEHPEIDVNKQGPLEAAAKRGHEVVVRLLLEHPDIDVNPMFPLQDAFTAGVTRLLLEHSNLDEGGLQVDAAVSEHPHINLTNTPTALCVEKGNRKRVLGTDEESESETERNIREFPKRRHMN